MFLYAQFLLFHHIFFLFIFLNILQNFIRPISGPHRLVDLESKMNNIFSILFKIS